jgi:hypothetical protein
MECKITYVVRLRKIYVAQIYLPCSFIIRYLIFIKEYICVCSVALFTERNYYWNTINNLLLIN